jgi:hypothetical protein
VIIQHGIEISCCLASETYQCVENASKMEKKNKGLKTYLLVWGINITSGGDQSIF